MTVTVTNVMAISLDGMIGKHAIESDLDRRAYGFTNMDDRNFVRDQLRHADAVITGANSLRASGSTWQVHNIQGKYPAWIVFTTKGIDEGLDFWRQGEVQRVLVSPNPVQKSLCEAHGVENWVFSENQLPELLSKMDALGMRNILLFGGGSINKLFYENGLVDYAKITLCPILIGAVESPRFVNQGLSHHVQFSLVSSVLSGDLVFLTYKVKK